MHRYLLLLVLAVLVAFGGRLAVGGTETQGARVTRVIDGDTIEVRVRGREETVRLIGIDTPERGDCGFVESSDFLHDRADERRVRLVSDPTQDERDRYDRRLAYVDLRDGGRDLGEMLVRNGWSRPYVYERDFRRLDRYRAAARKARQERRGLHRECRKP